MLFYKIKIISGLLNFIMYGVVTFLNGRRAIWLLAGSSCLGALAGYLSLEIYPRALTNSEDLHEWGLIGLPLLVATIIALISTNFRTLFDDTDYLPVTSFVCSWAVVFSALMMRYWLI